MARRTVLAAATAGVVLAGGVGGYMVLSDYRKNSAADDDARAAATLLAKSWSEGKVQNARYVGTSGAGAAANFRTATAALGKGPVAVTVGDLDRSGNTATANLRVKWTLRNGQHFEWVDPVPLAKSGSSWGVKVEEGSSLWHPKLPPNGSFAVKEADAKRGEILGKDGAKVMGNQTVYDVKIDPQKATADSVTSLESIVGQSGELTKKLKAAQKKDSEALIPVVTYRESDYKPKEDQLSALTGVVVSDREQPLGETRTFGQPLLGTVGLATADMIKKDDKLTAASVVGRSGLQKTFNSTLAPQGGLTVTVAGRPDQVLFGKKATDGKNLQTTLDPKVQRAAESALKKYGDSSPTALVAIDVKTGNVLSVANTPSSGINRAVSGHYQPGSTLKVSTTYALLTNGFKADTKVPCPGSIVVEGRRIGNFEQETLPDDATFVDSFAHSCNTAFVKASEDLKPDAMKRSAQQLGLTADWQKQLGIPAYSGSVPKASSKLDQAVTSFGQGKTLASPLGVAVMAGSIARGSYIPPQLISSAGGDRSPKQLDGGAIEQIKGMMRKVVTDGTATVLKDTPGGDVYAKTGTAEFTGEGGKPVSRAWLTGWQNDIAFAVLVEDVPRGSGGGDKAAPVAKDFLSALDASD